MLTKMISLFIIAVVIATVVYVMQRPRIHGNTFMPLAYRRKLASVPDDDAVDTPLALAVTDRRGIIIWATPEFSELTGYASRAVIGMSIVKLSSGLYPPHTLERITETVLSGKVWQGALVSRRRDARLFTEFRTITPVRGSDGHVTHLICSLNKGTMPAKPDHLPAEHGASAELVSAVDLLTGLPNRTALHEHLNDEAFVAAHRTPASLLLMDVDNLKAVNDVWGYAIGDVVLTNITRLIKKRLSDTDTLYRMAGDEFAVVLVGVDGEGASRFADRLLSDVEQMDLEFPTMAPSVSLSMGIVPLTAAADVETLLWMADAALLKAKESGKNRYVTYKTVSDVDRTFSETTFWAYRIKEALNHDQFELFLQPVVEMKTGEPFMAEALLRLRDEQGGVVGPNVFLPAAVRFGQLGLIDRTVVKLALELLEANPSCTVFVNISGASVGDTGFSTYVERKLKRSGVRPGQLGFEITETVAVTNLAQAVRFMAKLTDLGCVFALDDFGTGFSTFAYLQNLPVQYIKIDGSLVDGVSTSAVQKAIVEAIIHLSRALGKKLIAEHVINDGVRKTLLDMGVKYGQGNYFCPAASVSEILARYPRIDSAV